MRSSVRARTATMPSVSVRADDGARHWPTSMLRGGPAPRLRCRQRRRAAQARPRRLRLRFPARRPELRRAPSPFGATAGVVTVQASSARGIGAGQSGAGWGAPLAATHLRATDPARVAAQQIRVLCDATRAAAARFANGLRRPGRPHQDLFARRAPGLEDVVDGWHLATRSTGVAAGADVASRDPRESPIFDNDQREEPHAKERPRSTLSRCGVQGPAAG